MEFNEQNSTNKKNIDRLIDREQANNLDRGFWGEGVEGLSKKVKKRERAHGYGKCRGECGGGKGPWLEVEEGLGKI